MSSVPQTLSERVKGLALAVGFDVAGIAPAEPAPRSAFLREWLARGFSGEMHYLGRGVDKRIDPRLVLEGVQSVVALGLVYDPGPLVDAGPGALRVARSNDTRIAHQERPPSAKRAGTFAQTVDLVRPKDNSGWQVEVEWRHRTCTWGRPDVVRTSGVASRIVVPPLGG